MVRGKIVMEKIKNSKKRQVSFSKRKEGLFKKAQELAVLCEAVVAVIVYSYSGKLYEYSSSRMENILNRYNDVPESSERTTNENVAAEPQRKGSPLKAEMRMLQRMLRRLRKKELERLSSADWQPFEDLITEVSLAVKKQKEQNLVEELEKSKLKEEMAMLENATLHKELEDLKRTLALKEVSVGDPDTNLHLGAPGESSEKLMISREENDVEKQIQIE